MNIQYNMVFSPFSMRSCKNLLRNKSFLLSCAEQGRIPLFNSKAFHLSKVSSRNLITSLLLLLQFLKLQKRRRKPNTEGYIAGVPLQLNPSQMQTFQEIMEPKTANLSGMLWTICSLCYHVCSVTLPSLDNSLETMVSVMLL